MIGQMVVLKPNQAYAGCLGVVVGEVPRDHRPGIMYEVYIDELGTICRLAHDLCQINPDDIASGNIKYISSKVWLARRDVNICTDLLMHAIMRGNDESALIYADKIAAAEEILENEAA